MQELLPTSRQLGQLLAELGFGQYQADSLRSLILPDQALIEGCHLNEVHVAAHHAASVNFVFIV